MLSVHRTASKNDTPEAAIPSTEIRIVLADDHRVMRQGLISLLNSVPGYRVVAEAGDGEEAVALTLAERPQVLVVDVTMPTLGGAEVTKRVKSALPNLRVIALSMHDEPFTVSALLRAGADGYVLKDSGYEELEAALMADGLYLGKGVSCRFHSDGTRLEGPLSQRELAVLDLIAEGHSRGNIAEALGISVSTVDTYRKRIQAKTGAKSTAELVRLAKTPCI